MFCLGQAIVNTCSRLVSRCVRPHGSTCISAKRRETRSNSSEVEAEVEIDGKTEERCKVSWVGRYPSEAYRETRSDSNAVEAASRDRQAPRREHVAAESRKV